MVRADAAVVDFSGLTGEGLGAWIAARPIRPAPPLALDYDRYAAAEASLGWLNGTAEVRGDEPFDAADVIRRLLGELKEQPIAHAKVAVVEPALGIGALVRRGEDPRVEGGLETTQIRWMRLLVNVRVATSPAVLENNVRRAISRAAAPARVAWDHLACIAPARPSPKHRYTFRCGSGDDAACCSAFYQRTDVRYLLGDTLHPGGTRLTLALAEELRLSPGARVLDVACGNGESLRAILLRWPVVASGIDAGASPPPSGDFAFRCADAHALPFDDASFDAVLCECALSTFADPALALGEIHRVLKPGGRLAMSDMVAEGPIPEALKPFAHAGACLTRARSMKGWEALLRGASLPIERAWDESAALAELVSGIKRRLVGFALAKASGVVPSDVAIDVARGRDVLREVEQTLRAGIIRYGAYVARKGAAE
jgi:SAM-dependent methyltransferase